MTDEQEQKRDDQMVKPKPRPPQFKNESQTVRNSLNTAIDHERRIRRLEYATGLLSEPPGKI